MKTTTTTALEFESRKIDGHKVKLRFIANDRFRGA